MGVAGAQVVLAFGHAQRTRRHEPGRGRHLGQVDAEQWVGDEQRLGDLELVVVARCLQFVRGEHRLEPHALLGDRVHGDVGRRGRHDGEQRQLLGRVVGVDLLVETAVQGELVAVVGAGRTQHVPSGFGDLEGV